MAGGPRRPEPPIPQRVRILDENWRQLSQRQSAVTEVTPTPGIASRRARIGPMLGLKLCVFNKFGKPSAACCHSQPSLTEVQSFNELPGAMNVHVTAKAVAVDIAQEAE